MKNTIAITKNEQAILAYNHPSSLPLLVLVSRYKTHPFTFFIWRNVPKNTCDQQDRDACYENRCHSFTSSYQYRFYLAVFGTFVPLHVYDVRDGTVVTILTSVDLLRASHTVDRHTTYRAD